MDVRKISFIALYTASVVLAFGYAAIGHIFNYDRTVIFTIIVCFAVSGLVGAPYIVRFIREFNKN